jgi:hypothetical protein
MPLKNAQRSIYWLATSYQSQLNDRRDDPHETKPDAL